MTTFGTVTRGAPAVTTTAADEPQSRATLTAEGGPTCGPDEVVLCLVQGDTKLLRFTFTDSIGDPVDVSAWSVLSQIRDDYIDSNLLVEFTVAVTGFNTLDLSLTAAQTESLKMTKANDLYRWDVKVTEVGITSTVAGGPVTVLGTSSSANKP